MSKSVGVTGPVHNPICFRPHHNSPPNQCVNSLRHTGCPSLETQSPSLAKLTSISLREERRTACSALLQSAVPISPLPVFPLYCHSQFNRPFRPTSHFSNPSQNCRFYQTVTSLPCRPVHRTPYTQFRVRPESHLPTGCSSSWRLGNDFWPRPFRI